MDNYRQLLTIFLGIVLLSGCATSSQAPSAQVRRTVRHRDLDQACAKLVVELLSDPGWREFSAEYARRVRESHPDASERDCVPLIAKGERVLWACGLGIPEDAKLTPHTQRAVALRCRHTYENLF